MSLIILLKETYHNRPDIWEELAPTKQHNLEQFCQQFQMAGFECWLVGGAVRDLFLKRKIKDMDFATNAKPQEVQKIFKRTIPTGLKHGTVTVLFGKKNDSLKLEVTTYRADGDYSDARHPDSVQFSDSITEDLSRRDFTINALAYDPLKKVLLDAHYGLSDFESQRIRAKGDAIHRFHEDG